MKGRVNKSLCHCALAALLLGDCSKTPESPVAKTNPNPTQRYEITVELVDPPQDIREVSGVAHFGVSTRACLPYREKIARVTIGASYAREFPSPMPGYPINPMILATQVRYRYGCL